MSKSSLQLRSPSHFTLITGATAGIGKATALALAAQGFNLVLVARREDRLKALRDQLTADYPGIQVHSVICDLQDPRALDEAFEKNAAIMAKVNVLINSAGLAKGTESVQRAKWSDWEQMIDTNIKGLFQLTQKLLPLMEAHPMAHIVNLGSVAGRLVYPGGAVYCATKFAVRAFSDGLRMDLVGKKIRVTNIEPGMVNTEFSTVRLGDKEKADKVYAGMTPLSAEDIAETIVWSLQRPAHVNVQEMVIYPTDQATVGLVHRNS